MAELDPNRFAVGRGPVRRGSAPPPAAPLPPPDAARLARVGLQQRLAQPLRSAHTRRARLPRAVVAGLLGGAGLLLAAALAPSLPLALAAGTGGVLAWSWAGLRLRTALAAAQAMPAPIEGLAELETLLGRFGARLPAGPAAALLGLREQLAEALQHPLPGEDGFWLQALVSRYLPDTLNAWAQVPPSGAAQAEALLMEQLELLAQQLAALRRRQASAATEALRLQQRFLQAKAGQGGHGERPGQDSSA